MPKLVLGLDLGPNSIGWALIQDDLDRPEDSRIVNMGVRVFPEGVDAFDTGKEKSRNEDRRMKRGMRRQIQRRARRRRHLILALTEVGLWPTRAEERAIELAKCPYELRERALSDRLSPYEIGRVLLHLNQRRGFLSNRKKDRGDAEVKGMLEEINRNERERIAGSFATIGALLAAKHKALDHRRRQENDHVRNRHLSRDQLVNEFDAIWSFQEKFHPQLLTEQLKVGRLGSCTDPLEPVQKDNARRRGLSDREAFGLRGLMFFQRKMYWPKSVIGLCELEPKEKRCAKADRHAELFRVLQEINNLRYADPDANEECALSKQQRKLALSLMTARDKVTFDQLRKKLNFLESVKFNLERGERSTLKGMTVDVKLATATGRDWHDRPEGEKDSIVRLLIDNDRDDRAIRDRLVSEFGMTEEQAEAALGVDLPPGHVALSLKAIDRLLPHLQTGLPYQSASDPEQSALHAAGYLRRDELQRRLFDQLPDFSRMRPSDCKLGDIPNPVVKRALVELRKLVNAIIREYGKPDAIHVEMARSVQMGHERRREYNTRTHQREAAREIAAEAIRSAGVAVRRDSVLRYLLWQEQSSECMYCGQPISQQQLFGGDIDVDHILPYSRCLDDSQLNKVVCHRECNHSKGQQTPYEWLAGNRPADYARVVQQAAAQMRKGRVPYAKYRRFLQKELELDKFIARQLTDTGYITRATVEFLQLLFEQPGRVLGLKGQLTAELRWQWGLGTILEELPDSPAWQEKNNLNPGEKNRADHRHHAIDALVVALTDRRRLQQLSRIVRWSGVSRRGEILACPWDNFRDTVIQHVIRINVSHRVERKIAGSLHEETLYGPTSSPKEWVVRKPVESLSATEVERIRDAAIREIVVGRLRETGIEIGRGKKPDAKKMKAALANLTMPSGVPIRKVRILKPEQTIQPLRAATDQQVYVKPGSTHHLCIFEYVDGGKTKRDAVFVTMLEAVQRLKRGEPVIQRIHPSRPGARFIMSLSSREMVLANYSGAEQLLTYKTAASTQGQIYFALHTDARRSSDQPKIVFRANTLDARKVTVDPLGRIRWAND